MIDVSSKIKSKLKMREVVEYYGISVTRSNKALCPFHDDRNPSMHVYPENYHCFTCGAHGDVISFVQNLFDMNFQNAIVKLNFDFGLNLPIDRKPTIREYFELKDAERVRTKKQKERESIEKEYEEAYNEYAKLDRWKTFYKPKSIDEAPDQRFMEALSGLESAKFRLDLAESRLYGFKR